MTEASLFSENLDRWSLFCPNEAEFLRKYGYQRPLEGKTEKGETTLYHDADPQEEAKQWFNQLDLRNITVLFVYGVGSGYYYDAAKAWLQNPNHFLIFLEDDLEVIYRLFETQRGKDILYDKQVRLRFFTRFDMMDQVWVSLSETFVLKEYRVSSLKYYATQNSDILEQIKVAFSFWFSMNRMIHSEFSRYGQHFFTNFYQNFLFLPQAYSANGLFGKFSGIPAIICGAGPSLSKNLEVLKRLKNQALIFAGGSAMNAVNFEGFTPHFGAGVDPNPAQMTRLIMNTAYEVPFFYRSRMNHEALSLVQGPHLYVTGSGGYKISKWLETKLGIAGKDVDEGLNVINFSLSLAFALGCNPIIFVGLDLAYSDGLSYHEGVISHPTHDRRRDFLTKTTGDELLLKPDIYGNPVNTLWKWISESLWFGKFSREHPDILFINATEGGIGMPGIPAKPLLEVEKYLLQRKSDFVIRVHGEIQNNAMPETVTLEKIHLLIDEMFSSLEKAESYCKQLESLSDQLAKRVEKGNEAPENLMTSEMQEIYDSLMQELSYKYILKDLDDSFKPSLNLSHQQLAYDFFISSNESAARKILLMAERFKFLRNAAFMNQALINLYVKKKHSNVSLNEKIAQQSQDNSLNYSYENGMLTIVDPELKINIVEKTSQKATVETIFYPNQNKKFEQNLLNGELHGPVTYYKMDGTILAQSWYVHGKQQGKAWFYYYSGELYSLLSFRDGTSEGIQYYYYLDGSIRTSISYSNGELDGVVQLFYPNHKMKREQHFVKGKLHGIERMWNDSGLLILEAEYKMGKPINKARTWHNNGQLSLEIEYDEHANSISVTHWTQDGKLIEEASEPKQDYYDTIAKQSQILTQSLEKVLKGLSNLAPILFPEIQEREKLQEELHHLEKKILYLEKMHNEMLEQTILKPETVKEPIWKTPTVQTSIQKYLEETTTKLKKDIENIQRIVAKASKEIKDKDKSNE